MPLEFSEALRLVSSLESRGWRLGLDRMQEFLRRAGLENKLGSPGGPQFVHVAGTNGKGSVTAFAQSILLEQGWRTGATYSPFVYNVRERVQFGTSANRAQQLVSPEAFAALVEQLWPVAQSMEGTELGGPTEFEFKTAMGFLCWAENKSDFVALEVGMGGRLDATNVVVPASSAIVSIALDHTEHLGNSLGSIAIEKAGIVKEGKPVVVGDLEEEPLLAVETIAKIQQAPIFRYGKDYLLARTLDGYRVETPGGSYERLIPGLIGAAQPHNMAVAIMACEAAGAIKDPRKVALAVARTALPGRMQWAQYGGKRFLLDGAHNCDAAHTLLASLRGLPEPPGRIVLLTGMLAGHSATRFYEPLATVVDEVHFVPIEFHRARKPDELDSEAGWLFKTSTAHHNLEAGLEAVLASGADVVLVTGSFYLVGDVGRAIGVG
ncbi:MAG: bifunctional folylpolyglutamate synthase/dihydrofolate synthase [Armatimonadetes bacterium]|nr:bifunctional folylpolyglutamate synthase/dihydrofolate synthase [Armatimonadota bacterium]